MNEKTRKWIILQKAVHTRYDINKLCFKKRERKGTYIAYIENYVDDKI